MQNLVLKDQGGPVQKNDLLANPTLLFSNYYTLCHYRSRLCLEEFQYCWVSYPAYSRIWTSDSQAFSYPITSPASTLGFKSWKGDNSDFIASHIKFTTFERIVQFLSNWKQLCGNLILNQLTSIYHINNY